MALWILAALCAFFIKGLCGFANTLIFDSMLSFGASNLSISPVELLLGYPTNLIITWRERRKLKWSVCVPIAILVLAGSIPGALLLKHVDANAMKVLLGIVIVLISLEMFLRERIRKADTKTARKGSRLLLALVGVLSGLLCGMFGIGALLAVYLNHLTEDTAAFKSNLCFIFIAENTFRIILYAMTGIITRNAMVQTAMLFPFMLIGLFLGIRCSSILPEAVIHKIVILMLIVSGAALIGMNLF